MKQLSARAINARCKVLWNAGSELQDKLAHTETHLSCGVNCDNVAELTISKNRVPLVQLDGHYEQVKQQIQYYIKRGAL